jgi:hypothetical protein
LELAKAMSVSHTSAAVHGFGAVTYKTKVVDVFSRKVIDMP